MEKQALPAVFFPFSQCQDSPPLPPTSMFAASEHKADTLGGAGDATQFSANSTAKVTSLAMDTTAEPTPAPAKVRQQYDDAALGLFENASIISSTRFLHAYTFVWLLHFVPFCAPRPLFLILWRVAGSDKASEILPDFLYLGAMGTAKDAEFLSARRIGFVLNMIGRARSPPTCNSYTITWASNTNGVCAYLSCLLRF